jgi:methionyl-tRNA formyltransferase
LPESAGPGPGRPPADDRSRAVFFGSGEFGRPILEALAAAPEVELVGVISAPDRPAGRRAAPTATPVAARARELGLPLLQPVRIRDPEALRAIAELRPVVGVLADYGQIVPRAILELPPRGILNVHPSLLPRHRGATPIAATILAGDGTTGVSLIVMDSGVDTGPIVASSGWRLAGTETAPEVEAAAAAEGAELVRRWLREWLAGTVTPRAQDEAAATITRPLRREDGRLDPRRRAVDLERQVRAYQPWPGSFVETNAGRLTVWRAEVGAREVHDEPGRLVKHDRFPALTTADRRLVLEEVQPAGRRRMTGPEFLRGHGREIVGTAVH